MADKSGTTRRTSSARAAPQLPRTRTRQLTFASHLL